MRRLGKILTALGVVMFILVIAMAWELYRIRPNPLGDPEFRFMVAIVKPWIIISSIVLLSGCGLLSIGVSVRNALISGGVLTTLSALFWLMMSAFVSVHSWTAVFLLFWGVGCGAAVLFLLGAVVRYIAHLVRSIG